MKLSQIVLQLQILLIGFVNAAQYQHRCPEKCGNVTIPYPFGTQQGCYMDKDYYIECNSTTQIPRLHRSYQSLLSGTPLHVLEIKLDGHLKVNVPIAYACFNKKGITLDHSSPLIFTSRFPFSSAHNRFTGVGCDIDAHIILADPHVSIKCRSNWKQYNDVKNGSCIGHGCCKTIISQGMTFAGLYVRHTKNYTEVWDYSKCGYAFIVEKGKYDFDTRDLSTMSKNKSFPVVLEWSVGNTTCIEALEKKTYMCQENSFCANIEGDHRGYRCECLPGYMGNPYVQNGCQDINECESRELNDCLPKHCKNTNGSYTCVCPKGFQGNAKRGGGGCMPKSEKTSSVIQGISEGAAGAALAMILAYWGVKQRRTVKGRKDFFKHNGGVMLQKMLSACKDPSNKAKIFTEEELKKATNNFNKANVIGQGGYGTVYKGVLANNTVVAIKKAKLMDQSQIKEFVNEVIILSQINHPNIIKLLGCCLETRVPLLVYEYITNNNLRHHIQTQAMLDFGERLKIAAEIAEALAYMHSTTKIIHRDVKPSNILLDHEFTAKVSDFGISTFVPLGQTHLSTFVKGTIGYMDPEYFRTCKLTEKSDVYSFGVVLLELLTGTQIHSLEISLTVYKGAAAYLSSLLEHDALLLVLDDQLKRDKYAEVVKSVAKIAINCLDLEGKTRPTMIEVKRELKELRCLLLSIEAKSI